MKVEEASCGWKWVCSFGVIYGEYQNIFRHPNEQKRDDIEFKNWIEEILERSCGCVNKNRFFNAPAKLPAKQWSSSDQWHNKSKKIVHCYVSESFSFDWNLLIVSPHVSHLQLPESLIAKWLFPHEWDFVEY